MIAEVIVDIANSELDRIFDYKIISNDVVRGSRVVVPFGNRKIEGFVINVKDSSSVDESKLKPILRAVEEIPALTEECLALADFVCKKYHANRSLVLRLFLPTEMRKGKVRSKTVDFALLNEDVCVDEVIKSFRKNAVNQIGELNSLKVQKREKVSVLNEKFSSTATNFLKEKGYITIISERVTRTPYKELSALENSVKLTDEQQNALNVCLSTKNPTLIHGVTGSGKTEVYLRLLEKTISEGKSAIFLVPEIALTPQMLSRLRSRFQDRCAILHSGLSAGEKFDEWWRLRSGEAQIAVGARSAVFAPLSNLGLIIIDEEHETSYESETNPRYITSELAEFRVKYNGAKLILGSATPKIESYLKAVNGEYSLAVMSERVNKKPLPEIIVADMRDEIKKGNPSAFSIALKQELEKTLAEGNQAMIFLNRRGYSQKIICRECGFVAKCSHCDVALNYHKFDNLLKCHYCGTAYAMPSGCPDCGSVNINYSGTGTQKVVSDLNELFPNAKILRMDNDTTRSKEGHFKILKDFGDKKADILVGTQMIAKGHDFSGVTLVGILDADMSLYFSDFRSLERTFQLITQVAGRSGRADKKGKVVLQTFSPSNSILKYAISYDYKGFFDRECLLRKTSHFPPFSDIVRIMVESADDKLALETLKSVFLKSKSVYDKYQNSFVYFDKMKSPVKRMNDKFRYQVLCRIVDNRQEIEDELYNIALEHLSQKVNCYVEINPSNLS